MAPNSFICLQKLMNLHLIYNCLGLQCIKSLNSKNNSINCIKNLIFSFREKKFNFLFFSISDSKSAGLINHWQITEYRKLFKINLDDFDFTQGIDQKYVRLNLYQLQSTLYLFCCGNLFALFSLFFEIIVKYIFYIMHF